MGHDDDPVAAVLPAFIFSSLLLQVDADWVVLMCTFDKSMFTLSSGGGGHRIAHKLWQLSRTLPDFLSLP